MGLSLSPSSATLAGAPATTGCLKPYLLPSSNCPGSCARASCPKSPWQPHSHCLPTPKGTRRHQANTTFSYVLPTLPSTNGCPEWGFQFCSKGKGGPWGHWPWNQPPTPGTPCPLHLSSSGRHREGTSLYPGQGALRGIVPQEKEQALALRIPPYCQWVSRRGHPCKTAPPWHNLSLPGSAPQTGRRWRLPCPSGRGSFLVAPVERASVSETGGPWPWETGKLRVRNPEPDVPDLRPIQRQSRLSFQSLQC